MTRGLLGLLGFALACAGDETPAPVKVERGTDLLEPAVATEVREKLQGTFSMPWWRNGATQHPEVWSIDGETLTRWDGSKEETAQIVVIAPCLAKVEWPSGSFTYEEFVIDGETVWFGEPGGRTHGDRTFVCTSLAVWVLEKDGKCAAWEPGVFSTHASGLNRRDASCTLSDAGLFEAEKKKWQDRSGAFFAIDFDQRNPKPPTRFASLADAKAALAK